ncbi:MAG: cbb3-type cytochrome oxidase assembly protein CcoS [Leptolyngbya sp. PLA3]|nr:MAG: cbb3-type cytochrome oxidase assembly protein CcoS [Cyanobacteria bacterium CYA]MCE7968819.1 cbb3-type cytochrome oxidase assembly protein CcoS [Leptolyngbya sp. PL-A3]
MSVLYIMIPAALMLGVSALVAFILSLRGGQYDDLDTPPVRMLFDDESGKTTGRP